MAEKKGEPAQRKRPAAKKSAAPAKKKPAGGRGKAAPARMNAEAIRQRNQMRAVVMFACAIFLGCLVLIPGDNLWKWAHTAVLGLFGSWAMLWPVLMIYMAVVTTLEKPRGPITGKVWLTVVIIVLFCMTGFIFGGIKLAEGLNFGEYISALYTRNDGVGGGVIGGLLGQLLLGAVGSTGAKIIVLLLLFVALMVLTGTTLIGLFRTIKKPVDVMSEGLQNARQRREEERLILEQDRHTIDVPLDPVEVSPAVVAGDVSALFPKAKPKKEKPQRNEKLDKLQAVFGIEEEKPAEGPVQIPEPQPEAPETPAIAESTRELDEALKEIQEMPLPVPAAVPADPKPPVPLAEMEDISSGLQMEMPEKEEPSDKQEEFPGATPEQLALYQAAEQMQDLASYCFPPVSMLKESPKVDPSKETEELQTNGSILVDTLSSFGVQVKILDICRGPSVTRYEIQPAAGVKISKITNLADDLALNLAATGVRIEAPIPGKAAVGIEVPNKTRNTVCMRDLVQSNAFQTSKGKLSAALGRDIAGQPVIADLAKMPHLLIAGTTGSGKSVCINSIIISILYKANPSEVRFLMIDPKAVELTEYNGLPHMLVPVVTDAHKAAGALGWAVSEMMKRYKLFSETGVRNLSGYNALAESQGFQDENGQPMPALPQIVIIIDELADLMMAAPKDVEDSICRLAQLARAAGMHLVVATQRPSVDVVTGLIKANIPSRIALTVSSPVDSRTILDSVGAEKLLGRGDMLFAPVGVNKPVRVQGCFLADEEISSIVEFVKKTREIEYDESVLEEIERNAASEGGHDDGLEGGEEGHDPMLEEAVKCVVDAGQASTSLLQRRLRLGYARAGRIIDEMEQLGIVGPHEGSKPRQVLMTYAQWMERNMQRPDPPAPPAADGQE
ncbi:DNA translocase FtsK [Acutalibacter sp. JLR.KK004]|uniref:DNA translocase FtsK n=1 Tax=Acutalibacter sp. JLR.KK004 TaxID=3112622 RepID=UPI002FF251C8